MELSCVKGSEIIVDLEVTAALLDGCVPADSFENRLRPVIPETTLHNLKGGIPKQHPDFRMRLVELLKIKRHSRSVVR